MLHKKLPRNWRIEKTLLSRRKYWKNNEDWKNFLRNMISNHEQWVYREIKYEDYKNHWNILKTQKILYDPDSPTSYGSTYVPRRALITPSSRMSSREVGMLRNTREKMSITGNVFDWQHVQEIWQRRRGFREEKWEKWEWRTIAVITFTLLFGGSEGKRSRWQKLS